jgi:hypothetical protein
VPARKAKLHVYFVVDDASGVVRVVDISSQYRGGLP